VVIERSHLKHLDHRHAHFSSQGHDVALEQAPVVVIQDMQMFDQQIAPMARRRRQADQSLHLGTGLRRGLSALELRAGLAQLFAQWTQIDPGLVHQ